MRFYYNLIFFVLLFQPFFGFSQSENLVFNNSFEMYRQCPNNFGVFARLEFVFGWESANRGTPDYFNACSEKSGVPFNWVGKASAFHGKAYMGIIGCMQQIDKNQIPYREYIGAKLIQPLDSGKVYYASMQIRLGLSCNTACNGIGMFFSSAKIESANVYNYPLIPDIILYNDIVLDNKYQWKQICGTFVANGSEQYLIIGNFWSNQKMKFKSFDENLISTIDISPMAYYYIDFIEVYEISDEFNSSCENIDTYIPEAFSGYLPPSGFLVLDNLNFNVDKTVILASSYNELNELVVELKRNRNIRISINGHTDNTGSEQHNIELSLARANAVKKYLLAKGVSRFLIEVKGFGNSKPIADNDSDVGRKKNRRVEIEILE